MFEVISDIAVGHNVWCVRDDPAFHVPRSTFSAENSTKSFLGLFFLLRDVLSSFFQPAVNSTIDYHDFVHPHLVHYTKLYSNSIHLPSWREGDSLGMIQGKAPPAIGAFSNDKNCKLLNCSLHCPSAH